MHRYISSLEMHVTFVVKINY